MSRNRSDAVTRWVCYLRVSTDEQAVSGLGTDAQRAAIEAAAERAGATVVAVIDDAGCSGKDLDRPGIRAALELLAQREADVLAVAKLDRLSRSLIDVLAVAEWLGDVGAALSACDSPVDFTTPAGRMFLSQLGAFAEFERAMIGERTKVALAVRKARGDAVSGPSVPAEVVEQIRAWSDEGVTQRAICDRLTAAGVPTARGGAWRPSTVQSVLGLRSPARRKRPELPVVPRRRRLRAVA
jgi:DNA invertase Pin-like site-specific DNA recombinase